MILEPFKYFSPDTLESAFDLLEKYGESAKILAGGQSLIPIMKIGVEIENIIDIKKIKELSFIKPVNSSGNDVSGVEVGALVRHADIERSELLKRLIPILPQTAAGIGHPLVRNRGTIGGSLCHSDPAADLCVSSLVLDAEVVLSSSGGKERVLPVSEFLVGPLTTEIGETEILSSIRFPVFKEKTGYDVQKLTLGHGDFPVLIVSVAISYDGNRYNRVAISLGGVADTAVRAEEAEKMLTGKSDIGDEDVKAVASKCEELFDPPISPELSPEYTQRMIGVYVRRALKNALHKVEVL